MDVLAVTPEIFPLIKTGGLADVAGALPVALAGKGVAHPLADPVLRVFKGSAPLAENDNWSADATAANAIAAAAEQVGAFALPSGSKDAAILLTLAPGYYTVHIGAAANAGNGVALVEIYEIPEE